MKATRSLRVSACLLCTALLAVAGSLSAGQDGSMDAAAAFEKLKTLEGEWSGEITTQHEEVPEGTVVHHAFHVSANGSVVQEVMNEGTEHEMINMYHLDGDDLLMTHYCAGGNQPRLKLDLAEATPTQLPFVYMDGTNLDPAQDGHIHAGTLVFADDGTLDSRWTGWNEGKSMGTTVFALKRNSN